MGTKRSTRFVGNVESLEDVENESNVEEEKKMVIFTKSCKHFYGLLV